MGATSRTPQSQGGELPSSRAARTGPLSRCRARFAAEVGPAGEVATFWVHAMPVHQRRDRYRPIARVRPVTVPCALSAASGVVAWTAASMLIAVARNRASSSPRRGGGQPDHPDASGHAVEGAQPVG